MKLRILLLAFAAAAGVFASIAVAKPPQGHGNKHDATTASTTGTTSTTTTTGTTTTTESSSKKVLICHKAGNGHYVLVRVSVHSALARGKHKGDVLAVDGGCPGTVQGHHGHTTTTSTGTTSTTVPTTTT